eukprot:Opistho-2@52905
MASSLFSEGDFKEPFSSVEFLEKLQRRVSLSRDDARASLTLSPTPSEEADASFDPRPLQQLFDDSLSELTTLSGWVEKKIDRLERSCAEAEKAHRAKMRDLNKSYDVIVNSFQDLDERIKKVATKAVHLGDRLEAVNSKRVRATNARDLMRSFAEFDGPDSKALSLVFTEADRVHEAADVIQKLNVIAQELGGGDRYARARLRIEQKCSEIETAVMQMFVNAREMGDVKAMRECANTLYSFKGYSTCVDTYVNLHRFFKGTDGGGGGTGPMGRRTTNTADMFSDIVDACHKEYETIRAVFGNPAAVMAQFVQRVFEQSIQHHVELVMQEALATDKRAYLTQLNKLYEKTLELTSSLSALDLGQDPNLLSKLVDAVFCGYLGNYILYEEAFLQEAYSASAKSYYDSLGHAKRPAGPNRNLGLFQRVMKAANQPPESPALGGRGGLGSASASSLPKDSETETFLSIELALTMIHENREAISRCVRMSDPSELAGNMQRVFDRLLEHLCVEHVNYALDLASEKLGIEPKTEPTLVFFGVAQAANYSFHLLQNHFRESVAPALAGSVAAQTECIGKKNKIMELLEGKIASGLEKTLETIVIWLGRILETEQKKTEFRPNDDDLSVFTLPCTQACRKCCRFFTKQREAAQSSLDGYNADGFLTVLATRFHRVLTDHIRQQSINSLGGLLLTRDIAEYQNCVRGIKNPLIMEMFELLREISNIYVVRPENLRQVSSEGRLVKLDRDTLMGFVRLRSDFKTAGIAKQFES